MDTNDIIQYPFMVESQAESSLEYLWNKEFLRIGHSGAGAYARPNTYKSIMLALKMGVDMIEIDVRPCRDGLVLLHDDSLIGLPTHHTFASQCTIAQLKAIPFADDERVLPFHEALDLINGHCLINVDLKEKGYEAQVVKVLQKRLMSDVLVSSVYADSLRHIRKLAPRLKTAISYPHDRAQVSQQPLLKPIVTLSLLFIKFLLPYRIFNILREAQANSITLYYKVASKTVVEMVHQAKGRVFIWTVDDLSELRRLKTIKVDGITSNKPDLFEHIT